MMLVVREENESSYIPADIAEKKFLLIDKIHKYNVASDNLTKITVGLESAMKTFEYVEDAVKNDIPVSSDLINNKYTMLAELLDIRAKDIVYLNGTEGVEGVFESIGRFIKAIFNAIMKVIKFIYNLIKDIIMAIIDFFKSLFSDDDKSGKSSKAIRAKYEAVNEKVSEDRKKAKHEKREEDFIKEQINVIEADLKELAKVIDKHLIYKYGYSPTTTDFKYVVDNTFDIERFKQYVKDMHKISEELLGATSYNDIIADDTIIDIFYTKDVKDHTTPKFIAGSIYKEIIDGIKKIKEVKENNDNDAVIHAETTKILEDINEKIKNIVSNDMGNAIKYLNESFKEHNDYTYNDDILGKDKLDILLGYIKGKYNFEELDADSNIHILTFNKDSILVKIYDSNITMESIQDDIARLIVATNSNSPFTERMKMTGGISSLDNPTLDDINKVDKYSKESAMDKYTFNKGPLDITRSLNYFKQYIDITNKLLKKDSFKYEIVNLTDFLDISKNEIIVKRPTAVDRNTFLDGILTDKQGYEKYMKIKVKQFKESYKKKLEHMKNVQKYLKKLNEDVDDIAKYKEYSEFIPVLTSMLSSINTNISNKSSTEATFIKFINSVTNDIIEKNGIVDILNRLAEIVAIEEAIEV